MLKHIYNQIVQDTPDKRQSIQQQPVQAVQPAPSTTGSVAKSLDKDATFGTEFGALGLDMIFGGAAGISTGISFDTMYDAVDVYDEFVQDRFGNKTVVQQAPQQDPRLWMQPQPGMSQLAM
jgi:hypothetical protein